MCYPKYFNQVDVKDEIEDLIIEGARHLELDGDFESEMDADYEFDDDSEIDMNFVYESEDESEEEEAAHERFFAFIRSLDESYNHHQIYQESLCTTEPFEI